MAKVEKSEENARHCRCPICPVEKSSNCAVKKLNENLDPNNLNPENVGFLYCAVSRSSCSDFDTEKACLCPTCLVWEENNLQNYKYCLKGNAEEIG